MLYCPKYDAERGELILNLKSWALIYVIFYKEVQGGRVILTYICFNIFGEQTWSIKYTFMS